MQKQYHSNTPEDFVPRGQENEYALYAIIGTVTGALLLMFALGVVFFSLLVWGSALLGGL